MEEWLAAFERVVTGDLLVGALIGIASTHFMNWIARRFKQ